MKSKDIINAVFEDATPGVADNQRRTVNEPEDTDFYRYGRLYKAKEFARGTPDAAINSWLDKNPDWGVIGELPNGRVCVARQTDTGKKVERLANYESLTGVDNFLAAARELAEITNSTIGEVLPPLVADLLSQRDDTRKDFLRTGGPGGKGVKFVARLEKLWKALTPLERNQVVAKANSYRWR